MLLSKKRRQTSWHGRRRSCCQAEEEGNLSREEKNYKLGAWTTVCATDLCTRKAVRRPPKLQFTHSWDFFEVKAIKFY
jgi:hypothetical protein